ncbi:unnamed protein product [Phaedon cochleariae]|uniref:Cadherin domain-containing protein n=1 Tax=Phaedon cochleariae TaxID=80249 RepID=A0A9P0GWS5_PHACE|nr:unnamed protein product [Phaedon cochleariae]
MGSRVKNSTPRLLHTIMHWLLLVYGPFLVASVPRFDPSAVLRDILVPADAAAGSVIYRLRASDPTFDYPLVFDVKGQSSHVEVESLNCSRFNSVCQANVVLKTRIEAGRIYDFTLEVRSQRNEFATMDCSFRATNATTPVHKIFPGAPSLLSISEGARRNAELGTVLVRGNPNSSKTVLLELWGSPEFGLHQKLVTDWDAEGTVLLLSALDYEKKNMHHLTILANDPWTDMREDTRNIASWPLLVVVVDEQDTPPVFSIAPPTTTLSPSLRPDDVILRVYAEDGDRGNPRAIEYRLLPNDDNSGTFFNMDENSGELRLARPLTDIVTVFNNGKPILINVVAEEIRSDAEEAPAQSSTVQLALIPPGVTARSPTFGAIEYNALLDENAPTGSVLDLAQAEVNTQPGDVVALELENNNGTFDISPTTIIGGHSKFFISVHDPKLLDYESRQSVECYIVAKELGAGNYTARAKLSVLLNNVNDNPPKFTQQEYYASVQEHAKVGTNVLVVEAVDGDKDPKSKIRYTKLVGTGKELFSLDPDKGLIAVADSVNLDAESKPLLRLMVEAIDDNGVGLRITSLVTISLIDINDNIPLFEKTIYEFILNKDKIGFTNTAIIRATDKDISPPNNEVHYEILNIPNNLYIDEKSGELTVTGIWKSSEVTVLRARVWDGGVPRLSSECEIRIYPSEGQARKMVFIVPGTNPDRVKVAETLRTLTGGIVSIQNIRPYTGDEPGAMYVSNTYEGERSVVEATVTFFKDSIVDLNEINRIINSRKKENQGKEIGIIDNENQENKVREREIIRIKESDSSNLLWLLILFFIILIIALLALICCCLCKQCPLYNYVLFKKRKDTPVIEKIEKIHIIGSGQGRENKSVQVAEWFGRKEAWTPENAMIDHEAESMRRHEMDRGSENEEVKRTIPRPTQIQQEPLRDQFYYREGNTDILRLITRGGDAQRPISLADPPYMAADSGKDILMRRFMEQQTEGTRSQVFLPNTVNRLQAEQEIENSLRQQNALLRQILLERERDLRLETQSLPAGTQTDQDAETQTEPIYLRPPLRKVRSDNDQSDPSDHEDEISAVKAKARRRHGKKSQMKREIRTPIQEEVEIEIIKKPVEDNHTMYRQTKTSELRTRRKSRASSGTRSSQSRSSKSNGLRKEVLEEISASLEQMRSDGEEQYYQKREIFSDDSLEITPRSDKTSTDSARQKYHSESDLRQVSPSRKQDSLRRRRNGFKSRSQIDLTRSETERKQRKITTKHQGSRYMEWYKKKPTSDTNEKRDEKARQNQNAKKSVEVVGSKLAASSRVGKDTGADARKDKDAKKNSVGPEHPLLQHSERRFEVQYPEKNKTIKKPEEDNDSGIVLNRPPITQKKSVFTIAYNDIHTKQLRADSTTSP